MTRTTRTRRLTAVVAGASLFALTVAGCSSDEKKDENGEITLTISTFNEFGYTDEILQEYMDSHPGIKIKHTKAATTAEARTNLTTKIAAGGSGLADIEGIEVDWMPEMSQIDDGFEDFSGEVDGRFAKRTEEQGITESGKHIGLGTDIGPMAICYRADLFEAAGLPSDRESVAAMMGGETATWETYFEAGKTFTAASDAAWYDSVHGIYQGMIGQVEDPYEDPETGKAKDLGSNTQVKAMYDLILESAPELSAGYEQWSEDWNAGFQATGADTFATTLCPPWFTGSISTSLAPTVEGWDMADVFPGGGGNWGGSFLTVPTGGDNVEEARELALWLTAPEQQARWFLAHGNFPSQVDAWEDTQVTGFTNEFFNDAPAGSIFVERAKALDKLPTPYKGQAYFAINQLVLDALKRADIEATKETPAESWEKAVGQFGDLGLDV